MFHNRIVGQSSCFVVQFIVQLFSNGFGDVIIQEKWRVEGSLLREVQWLRMILMVTVTVLATLCCCICLIVFMRMYTAHVLQIHLIYCVSLLLPASLAQDNTQHRLSPCH